MESSTFSHREPVQLDYPNALRALRAALATLGRRSYFQRTITTHFSGFKPDSSPS